MFVSEKFSARPAHGQGASGNGGQKWEREREGDDDEEEEEEEVERKGRGGRERERGGEEGAESHIHYCRGEAIFARRAAARQAM